MKRIQTLILSKLSDTRANLDWHIRQSKKLLGKNSLASAYLTPIRVSQLISYVFILLTLASSTYWLIHILQIPSPAEILPKNFKGITLHTNQDIGTSYKLFGSKPLAAENIVLRVLVVTGKNEAGLNQGFALFDIDGKSTGAIAVGEQMDRGMMLQSINPDSATLLYQGKELNFALQKSKNSSSSNDRPSQVRKN
ncbi:hypothetical protein G6675_03020 [Polynucleobacter paneuropaeus]|nr:hypothetical protein [Polynucleobacter paneuropaeus]MBT8599917.1 hypothetical protein [Polynucleobacter paneuropaeus]MBT8605082.1 hypothetical protein [Polynucleobacter paneuropaeus]